MNLKPPHEDAFVIEDPDAGWPSFRMTDAASWLFPMVGLLVFECFADPCLAVVIGCLKFGYNDLRTGWWLQGDRRGFRGTALSLCYFARGLYVVAASAFLLVLALILCEPLLQQNPLANLNSILAGLVMWFCGLFLGTACGGVALQTIERHKIRVWMDPSIHAARRDNRWSSVCTGTRNQFRMLVVAVMVVCGSALSLVFISAAAAGDWQGLIGATAVLGIPSGWCLYCGSKCWFLAADQPDACWGEEVRHV